MPGDGTFVIDTAGRNTVATGNAYRSAPLTIEY